MESAVMTCGVSLRHPMLPVEKCAERKILSRRAVEAITEVYRVKNEYKVAEEKKAEGLDALALALQKARAAERVAANALEEHIYAARMPNPVTDTLSPHSVSFKH